MNISCKPSTLLVICMCGFPQLSETICSPSLPNISSDLGSSVMLTQWLLGIYFIGFALGVYKWGYWSDKIGRRHAALYGVLIYCIGSLFCMLSSDIYLLLIARFFQAFGASIGSVITMTILRDSFDDKERGKIFSVAAVALALAPALGTTVGGIIVELTNWRMNFLFLIMMGVMVGTYMFVKLPETSAKHINKISCEAKLQISMLALWKRMLIDPKVIGSAIIVATFNGILFSFYAEGPFVYTELFKFTPSQYGIVGLVITACGISGGWLSHRLTDSGHSHFLIPLGCFLSILSTCVMFSAVIYGKQHSSYGFITMLLYTIPLFGVFMSFNLVIPSTLSKVLTNYGSTLGSAGAIFGAIYYSLIALVLFGIGVFSSTNLTFLPVWFFFLSILNLIPLYMLKNRNKY